MVLNFVTKGMTARNSVKNTSSLLTVCSLITVEYTSNNYSRQ
jgi:hypothetical protein